MNTFSNNSQSPQFLIDGVLRGDIAVLSRAITLIESSNEQRKKVALQVLEGVIHKTGNSFRLGITGVPGVGKSTFIESFGKEIVKRGSKLAVLAIDPSSSKSKGSILGDKTRMEQLSAMPNVYVRPSPSSGTLGGIARASYETMLLCEAAGYDFIIIETVGVGQSEMTVSRVTDFFLLLMLAGAGDELQGIKRGIMEMADAVVITKADGANIQKAKAARVQYESAMHLLQMPESGFAPKVLICSSIENTGISEVLDLIEKYRDFVHANSYFTTRRKLQQRELLFNFLDEKLKEKFYSQPEVIKMIAQLEEKSLEKNYIPFNLANDLVNTAFKK